MDLQGTGGWAVCADLGARLLCQQPALADEPIGSHCIEKDPPPAPLVLVGAWRREHTQNCHCNSVSREKIS